MLLKNEIPSSCSCYGCLPRHNIYPVTIWVIAYLCNVCYLKAVSFLQDFAVVEEQYGEVAFRWVKGYGWDGGKVHLNCPGVLHKKRHVFMEWLLLRNGRNDSQYYHRTQVILPSILESHNEGQEKLLWQPQSCSMGNIQDNKASNQISWRKYRKKTWLKATTMKKDQLRRHQAPGSPSK